jgi:hypothetical protein
MTTITTPSIATQVLTTTINQHVPKQTCDTALIRELCDAVLRERGVDVDEDVEAVVSNYADWCYAIKELEQADDTYYNAETDSDDEAEALCEKNAAEAEVHSRALTLKWALNEL